MLKRTYRASAAAKQVTQKHRQRRSGATFQQSGDEAVNVQFAFRHVCDPHRTWGPEQICPECGLAGSEEEPVISFYVHFLHRKRHKK